MRLAPIWSILTLSAVIACSPNGAVDEGVDATLSPREQLIRVSVDLRGRYPTETELVAIEQDPSLYASFVDEYLYDPAFLDQVEEMYNGVLRTRTGETYFDPAMAGVSAPMWQVAESVGSEPLKLISHVVDADRPFTDILTADYTMADETVAAMWGLPHSGTGWQPVSYNDGRPTAGVLSSTTLWTRYPSAGVNANRHRANQVSRMFLCDDYLSRPVSFTRNQVEELTDSDPNDVINSTGTCQSCHASLDPLAAHFFGFWWDQDTADLRAATTYRSGDEALWQAYADRQPAYFGSQTGDLGDLGQAIAADPRFAECTVKTVIAALNQREVNLDEDWTLIQSLREQFTGSDYNFRELMRGAVTSESYLAASFVKPETGERIPVVRTVSPRQLAAIIEQKTGYQLAFGGVDALKYNQLGLGVLAGGIDGRAVTERSYNVTVSAMFVHERLAQAAAVRVAVSDLSPNRTGDAKLLGEVDVYANPDDNNAAFRSQIRSLHRDILGRPIAEDAPQIDELIALWKQTFSVTSSPTTSWAAVIAAVLRDPQILFY